MLIYHHGYHHKTELQTNQHRHLDPLEQNIHHPNLLQSMLKLNKETQFYICIYYFVYCWSNYIHQLPTPTGIQTDSHQHREIPSFSFNRGGLLLDIHGRQGIEG